MNIYDIAEKSGVSIATVSRVLNNADNVRAQTRERVLQVMKEAGYSPNPIARGLSRGSMRMVGVLCTNIRDPFYAAAVGYIEEHLREQALTALLRCTGDDREAKRQALDNMTQQNVDAVILVGSAYLDDTDNSHIAEAARHIPIIVINGYVEIPNVYCVRCDERGAMCELVQLLLRRNRQRILLLHSRKTYSCQQKINGYLDGHTALSMPTDEARIVEVNRELGDINACIKQLLVRGVSFDAVVATEDILAVGAQKALQRIGLTMPIVGFNNSAVAQCCSPELTTIDNELEKMCATALTMLHDLLDGRSIDRSVIIPAHLVERESFRYT